MTKKINYQKLEKELQYERKNCWEVWDEKTKKSAFSLAEEYKQFLNLAKTEREAVRVGIKIAETNGFKNIINVKSLKPGDKVYAVNRDKNLALIKIGQESFSAGLKIIMSHIDSPRLDLKVMPLYEDENLAFFKTHYYGGIKKYQWPTISLALHGVIYLANGKKVEINIGEKENDPVFMITDLLPHLDRPGGPGTEIKNTPVKGEELNLLVGSIPVNDKKVKQKVKLGVLKYLHTNYGLKEEDFASAELTVVPAEKARDLGFDRSLLSGYGHDDRICAFASLKAILSDKISDKTQICFWTDREEIGSDGNTGAKSIFIESMISDLIKLAGGKGCMEYVYKVFSKSNAISADVTAGVDPDYKDVHDLKNAHRLGYGVALEKYTGAGGKYSTSEASGQFIQELRAIFAKNKNIVYQINGALGKVDNGGGGTIAKYLANRNIEVVDMGVSLFNMHAPLEIASKADLYAAYLAYKAFLEN